jgi:hypothetical protein
VRIVALLAQGKALGDTETMLFVDNGEAEAPEDAVLGDRVLLVIAVAWVVTFGLGALGV